MKLPPPYVRVKIVPEGTGLYGQPLVRIVWHLAQSRTPNHKVVDRACAGDVLQRIVEDHATAKDLVDMSAVVG